MTKNDLFDLEIQEIELVTDDTGESVLTTILFSKSWWGNSDGGSRLQETAEGIIDNNTRQNVTAVLNEICQENSSEKLLKSLTFSVSLNLSEVHISAKWDVESTQKSTNFTLKS